MKHKKVYHLQDPSPDPFLVNSDMEADLLRKYHYLENESYHRYKRRERIHLIAIIVTLLILAGIIALIAFVPAAKINALIP